MEGGERRGGEWKNREFYCMLTMPKQISAVYSSVMKTRRCCSCCVTVRERRAGNAEYEERGIELWL